MKAMTAKPILFVLIVAAQLAALGAMIAQRQHILDHGKLVRLECEPVDPRSLLSGDYVILNYKISQFSQAEIKFLERGEPDFRRGRAIWVALKKNDETGFSTASAIASEREQLGDEEVVLRGRVQRAWGSGLQVLYGLEQYFVPQKQGLEIERHIRDTTVEVAVGDKGRGAVKQLFISGVEVKFH